MRPLLAASLVMNFLLGISILISMRTERAPAGAPPALACVAPGSPALPPARPMQPGAPHAFTAAPSAQGEPDFPYPTFETGKGEGCEELWKAAGVALTRPPAPEEDKRDAVAIKDLVSSLRCKVPPELLAAHKSLYRACLEKHEPVVALPPPPNLPPEAELPPELLGGPGGSQLSCLITAKSYADAIVDWQTRDIPIRQINDRKLLARKLLAAETFPTEGVSEQRALELSERMLELEPNNPDIVKLYLEKAKDQLYRSPEQQTRALAAIEKVAETRKNDRELEDSWMQIQFLGPGPVSDEALSKFERLFPSSALDLYAKASLAIEKDDRESAAKWVKQALTKDPRDMRFVRFAEALERGERPVMELLFPAPNQFAVDRERLTH